MVCSALDGMSLLRYYYDVRMVCEIVWEVESHVQVRVCYHIIMNAEFFSVDFFHGMLQEASEAEQSRCYPST